MSIRSKHPHPLRRLPRRGFSFTEVLFAVMILGIGFIMIAGIFPVAISQTQSSSDDTLGAGIARGAVEYMSRIPMGNVLIQPGGSNEMKMISPAAIDINGSSDAVGKQLAALTSGNQIIPEDSRYAWVGFYRRVIDWTGQPSNSAQVVVLVCRARENNSYTMADLSTNLAPQRFQFTYSLVTGDTAPDTVQFSGNTDALAEGTYIVVASDPSGISSGWILKLGSPTDATRQTWELAPGNDLKSAAVKPANGTTVTGFAVGRARDGAGNFSGATQTIAAYGTYVPVN